MTKQQVIVITGAIVLFLVLYFGCDTKPPGQKSVEKSRAFNVAAADESALLKAAKQNLGPSQLSTLESLEGVLNTAEADSSKIIALEDLSRFWYQAGKNEIAGIYAAQLGRNDRQR